MVPKRKETALVVVDVQNDFCPGGALAVHEGDRVIEPINRIMGLFDHVVLTQDWHPLGHVSFASSWPGRTVHERVDADGIDQVLWPDHCVAGTEGADFHPHLDTVRASLILRKGRARRLDSYSAIQENDRTTSTGLEGWLRNLGITTIFLAGLATDYCVLHTGLDTLAAGFGLVVVDDAVRGVDVPDGSVVRALSRLASEGAIFTASAELADRG